MNTNSTRRSPAIRFGALAAAALFSMGAAHAAEFKAGDWTLGVNGIVNAYETHTSCSGSQAVSGLALASQALGCAGASSRNIIGNGLLPNALVVTAKGKEDGLDIGATLMIGMATASGDAISNNNNVDVRQGFFTLGDGNIGTFKLGRDYGLFGANAILGDMTLIGAGAPVGATQRNRVTLGHIGSGYSYLGTYGQIAWASAPAGGFSANLALVSPVDSAGGEFLGSSQPQIQARAGYAAGPAKVWVSAKSQKFTPAAGGDSFTMSGVEVGGSVAVDGFGLLVNLQSGKGLGVLADADAGNTKQDNLFVQGTWQAAPKLKLGLNWGQTELKDSVGTGLKSNRNTTAGAYWSVTKSITLSAEVSQTQSRDAAGDTARMNGLAVGGILFF